MNLNPKYVQLVGDALIPLLGFFLWDWSLYFILLFYGLDIIANEIIIHLKSRKIVQFQADEKTSFWIRSGILSFFTILCIGLLVHLTVFSLNPTISFQQEIIDFWTYEELGIQQGYILFPLIALTAYQQFNMFFIRPQTFRKVGLNTIWKNHLTALLVILVFSGLTLGVAQLTFIPELAIVLGIVVLSSVYSLLVQP